ncbi:uncharacterized protein F4822DRAFT_412529 [Hypoxylon trugodes]|uniref:uncharacterized protein n=1 Tax=Hypoxylon trugodes TaxID=326681 RepID=UPI00219F6309|nr:uncharacterized protein F4822DRAFT_412529 [Hypoxylon trugodes]KAI1385253.1 hypothetical protein F4822DRAFT_412529 [Hypoxylon trugodes]
MEGQGRNLAPLRSLILDLPPSCIEFCPGHPNYFVVGTYNLQKEDGKGAEVADADADGEGQQAKKATQTRNGSLVLFRLTGAADINHVQTVLYPSAILDLHFHPSREGHTVLSVVSSTGTLSFFRLRTSEESPASLEEISTHRPLGDDEGILFLSCSWHPYIPELLAITTSNHQVHILRVDDSWNVRTTRAEPVITHSLEAWTVAFSSLIPRRPNLDPNVSLERNSQLFTLFSGGDDSKLFVAKCLYHPIRIDSEADSIESPFSAISLRGHEAGVTAILPLNLQIVLLGSVVVTGSYDDHIRVYTINDQKSGLPPQNPKLIAERNLEGGVWRLKLIKLEKTTEMVPRTDQTEGTTRELRRWKALILASCMHAGSRVVEITGDAVTETCQINVLGRFEEHKSMNYGSDFQPGSESEGRSLRCISTSFYDRLLCLWEY